MVHIMPIILKLIKIQTNIIIIINSLQIKIINIKKKIIIIINHLHIVKNMLPKIIKTKKTHNKTKLLIMIINIKENRNVIVIITIMIIKIIKIINIMNKIIKISNKDLFHKMIQKILCIKIKIIIIKSLMKKFHENIKEIKL
jgi:hypothetical protein